MHKYIHIHISALPIIRTCIYVTNPLQTCVYVIDIEIPDDIISSIKNDINAYKKELNIEITEKIKNLDNTDLDTGVNPDTNPDTGVDPDTNMDMDMDLDMFTPEILLLVDSIALFERNVIKKQRSLNNNSNNEIINDNNSLDKKRKHDSSSLGTYIYVFMYL
jgi:hypothetical protein